MKKVLILMAVIATVLIIACQKEGIEQSENYCPVMADGLIPQAVKDSFTVRYPVAMVITWFNKDSIALCAYFTTSYGTQMLAEFTNTGSFLKEEVGIPQTEGQNLDSTKVGNNVSVCKCGIPKKQSNDFIAITVSKILESGW